MDLLQHKHLIISCKVKTPPKDSDFIKEWMKDLISLIQMEILIGPEAIYYDVPGNKGITAFAIITTSHIVLHTFDDIIPANFELDIYSCKDFNIDSVFQHIEQFKPESIKFKFLDRENNFKVISSS